MAFRNQTLQKNVCLSLGGKNRLSCSLKILIRAVERYSPFFNPKNKLLVNFFFREFTAVVTAGQPVSDPGGDKPQPAEDQAGPVAAGQPVSDPGGDKPQPTEDQAGPVAAG